MERAKHWIVIVSSVLMVALTSGLAVAHGNTGFGTVTGTISYRQRIALPDGAEVWVELADVSRADAPAQVIASQLIITDGRQVPFNFALSYEVASIRENGRYAVSARIYVDGALRWTSDTVNAVITNDVNEVAINVVQVAAPEVSETPADYSGVLTGMVSYPERIALPENAVVSIELQDTSRMDAPAFVLAAQQMVTNGRQVPLRFSLNYDAQSIDARGTYSVRATITLDGELRWTSDTVNPVITNGVTDVAIALVAVG